MEIILKEDIIGLGEEGDIKNVADGYARNFLLPKGLAIQKSKTNLRWLERQQDVINKRKEVKADNAKGLAEQIKDLEVTVSGKVSSGMKLYGSIHAHQITDALKEKGIEIDQRKIEIGTPIKHVGDFTVTVKLYEGVQVKLKVKVVSEDGEQQPRRAAPAATSAEPSPASEDTAADENSGSTTDSGDGVESAPESNAPAAETAAVAAEASPAAAATEEETVPSGEEKTE